MTLGLNEVTGLAATIVCAWGVVGLAPHLLRPERRGEDGGEAEGDEDLSHPQR